MRGSTNGWCSPRLRLRVERFKAVAGKRGWFTIAQISEGIGISQANVSRLVSQRPDSRRPRQQMGQAPGPAFIAAALHAFGPDATFEDLFEVIPNPANRRPRSKRPAA